MKKVFRIMAAVFAVVTIGMLVSCSTVTGNEVIVIEMSDEAKAHEKQLFEEGDKAWFEEGSFEYILESLYGRSTEQILPECELKNSLDCETFEGCNVYSLSEDNYENIVLYIHGGAWVFEISDVHVTFCDELATRLNAKVYMPLYPLAPQANAEETYTVLENFYKKILEEGKTVYVMGDSAGGELTLGLLYTIKKEGLKKPAKVVVMAPCSDMTFTNKDIADIEPSDPELASYGCKKCAELWAGADNLANPKYSAVYADVSGYPDIMIIQGTSDILSADNYILYEKLKKAKVNVKLVKGEGLWHVFPVSSIPERETTLKIITEFCAQ